MRNWIGSLMIVSLLFAGACTRSNNQQVGRNARKVEQGSDKVAHAAGKAAYKVAQAGEKAAVAAGHQLGVATREAHQGWVEEKQKEKAKARADR